MTRRDPAERALTDAVVATFADRLAHSLMASLVRHLHAFASEVQLTDYEWHAAIDFLTRTGQLCDDHRQEFVLLSDVLGLSMLVGRSTGAARGHRVHRLRAVLRRGLAAHPPRRRSRGRRPGPAVLGAGPVVGRTATR